MVSRWWCWAVVCVRAARRLVAPGCAGGARPSSTLASPIERFDVFYPNKDIVTNLYPEEICRCMKQKKKEEANEVKDRFGHILLRGAGNPDSPQLHSSPTPPPQAPTTSPPTYPTPPMIHPSFLPGKLHVLIIPSIPSRVPRAKDPAPPLQSPASLFSLISIKQRMAVPKSTRKPLAAVVAMADTASWYCALLLVALVLLSSLRGSSQQAAEDGKVRGGAFAAGPPCDEIYVVGDGETLQTISEKCGDPFIVEQNPHIHDPDDVFPGLVIKITPSKPAARHR
ncbi:hypothetical protein Taro_042732 [Colocasia esculenta]|uniref:LysM domain-containing protein n=1 Tax=Colocasia esculenta TaxID=4460 RepID=A0A843WHL9_COLES|nr:hypothetical protein [Colocasia esculenta]